MPAFRCAAGWVAALLGLASGVSAQTIPHGDPHAVACHGHAYLVQVVDPKKDDLRLYSQDASGRPLHNFTALEARVRADGARLLFAANAGMFQPDFSPVGLLVLNGNEVSPLNLADGAGNFFLKPNGVFALTDRHEAEIMESSSYTTFLPRVLWATQSGPLMVHRGEIHPDLIESSANVTIRSGVGVRKDGTVVFAISRGPVNFYDFAWFFLTRLRCPNALYLDGHISAFHFPGQPEKPGEHLFGPMFALVKQG